MLTRLLALLTLVVACAIALPKLQQELNPQNGGSYNGFSVAINAAGTRAVIGGDAGLATPNGSVTVFERSASTWTQTALLTRGSLGLFGFSVDISADGRTIVVGDPYYQEVNGAVFIYENIATSSWDTGTPLTFSGANGFGFAVTIAADGNTLAAIFYKNGTEGAGALVYSKIGSAWALQGTVFNPNNNAMYNIDLLQEGLVMSGDGSEMVVGYPGVLGGPCSLGYYKRNSSLMWSMSGPYISINGTELLGSTLTMTRDASYVVSGMYGGVYVFKKSISGETFEPVQVILLPVSPGYYSIPSVSIQPTSGTQIFLGNAFDFVGETGAVYVYNLQGGSFVQVPGHISSGITDVTGFGFALDQSDSGTLLVGAPKAYNNTGAAFIFGSPNGCNPSHSLNRLQCIERSLACANILKWTGKGCRIKKKPLGDGGCQCRGYCGYKCRGACNSDKECTWSTTHKACYVKATQQPGGPIISC